jgi:plasmid stabilization system protein ParE
MKVVFDPRAVEDLEHIHDFIASDSPLNADAVVDRILSSIEKLGEFPSMARAGRSKGRANGSSRVFPMSSFIGLMMHGIRSQFLLFFTARRIGFASGNTLIHDPNARAIR